jgi:glycine cleavage system aminomethyltransferase T
MMESKSLSDKAYFAIRNSVALEDETNLRCLLIRGEDSFKLLDRICPCNVFLQNGQMKHTLLLDENAVPFADIYVCRNRESAYLLGYVKESAGIIDWIFQHKGSLKDFLITDLNETNCFLTLNGPYAWELCAEVVGSEILGMPYLSMMSFKSGIVFRAGTTGEFGYHLVIPSELKNSWINALINKGSAYDIELTDKTTRSQCTLENFFFDLDREGQYLLTPPELQLQWRLSRNKREYPGARTMQFLREKGWNKRLTCFVTKEPANVNDLIYCKNESVGFVLSIGYSPLRKEFVGKALINRPYWHAGLDCFHVNNQMVETISAPAINNLSLRVNPYLDSYFTRNDNESVS